MRAALSCQLFLFLPTFPICEKFQLKLLSWGSALPSLGRPGPVFVASFHLDLEKEPEWFLWCVRAAAAQFRRVLQPQRVGYNRQCFCGRYPSASSPFRLVLRLIWVYCPSTGERALRVFLTANERLIIAHLGVLTQEVQLSKLSYDEI